MEGWKGGGVEGWLARRLESSGEKKAEKEMRDKRRNIGTGKKEAETDVA